MISRIASRIAVGQRPNKQREDDDGEEWMGGPNFFVEADPGDVEFIKEDNDTIFCKKCKLGITENLSNLEEATHHIEEHEKAGHNVNEDHTKAIMDSSPLFQSWTQET